MPFSMSVSLLVHIVAFAATLHKQPADLALRNGNDPPSAPFAPPIQWIGNCAKVINLHGIGAIPGFPESHDIAPASAHSECATGS